MPDDFAHFIDLAPRRFVFHGNTAVRLTANSNPSVKGLLSRNSALAKQNSQLTGVLAAVEAAPVDQAPQIAKLTPRQREVMGLVLAGHPSKNIAADLKIASARLKTTAPRSCSAPGPHRFPRWHVWRSVLMLQETAKKFPLGNC